MPDSTAARRTLRLRDNQKGDDVRSLQREANERLRARGQNHYVCHTDGEYGPFTARACHRALYVLGIHGSRLRFANPKHGGHLSVDAQRMIKHPELRTAEHERRGQRRVAAWRKAEAKRTKGRDGAVRWARGYIGTTEDPAGSNRGPHITGWQSAMGSWLVGQPWCGVFCGTALNRAGVKGVTSRIASVMFIEDDAKAGRGPFKAWTYGTSGVKPGDLAVIGGRGVHVELVVRVYSDGSADTIGGNTSSGPGGSQGNGGGVWARNRSASEVYGFAKVRYP